MAIGKSEIIYKITSFIPKGKVSTYTSLADLSGVKSPRLVGNLLHQNLDPEKIPCHRVVNSSGLVAINYAFGGVGEQIRKLREEGVGIIGKKVNLSKHLWQPNKVLVLYFDLLKQYGAPGLWPWFGGDKPHTREEIALGAILTQNTNWRNVKAALGNLREEGAITIKQIYHLGRGDFEKLKVLIRPSGFYNQKAERLFSFSKYIIENFQGLENFFELPLRQAREKLLTIKGIGKETADTILLYAGEKPIFVIDNYTVKFVKAYNLSETTAYDSLQKLFITSLPKNAKVYQEYHALIVRWGKET